MTSTSIRFAEQASAITPTWVRLAELLAAVLFILALKGLSSPKSARRGNLLGAAGAIEAIACVLACQNDIIPPTINHFNDDPALDNKLNLTFNKAQKRVVRAALSNTFGFGGHNASVIVKKYTA